ncbi:MAG: beta-lactamase family protein [Halomonas subglaciescola]|nr:beta-lactamase family protein [Halomonas subglaciescola]
MSTRYGLLLSSALLALSPLASAGAADTPRDESVDAGQTGWMQGFPPPEDRTIRFTDDDYFAPPKQSWTVCHFRELMPTAGVDNGTDGARELPTELDDKVGEVSFTPTGSDDTMTFDEAFAVNHSDGVLVMHKGEVVYERYAGCLDENTLHGVMSVTKSITGLVGETLVAEGTLDDQTPVRDVIPELADSAFGDATVRQVMDMTTALDYSEDYSDPDADVWTYAKAGSPLPPPDDYDGPRSYFAFLETVEKDDSQQHGEAFGYRTVNADALGWLIARSTGQSVADWLAERVWSRLGTEREAFYTVDSIGTPFAGGGFNATLRDLGRLGQLVLNGGELDGEQIIPADAIDNIRQGGSQQAFAKAGYEGLPDWSYRGMWWVSHDDHGAFAARGVHGQTIWIDPEADMVIVRLASHPKAANAASDATSLPAYRAVGDYLMEE